MRPRMARNSATPKTAVPRASTVSFMAITIGYRYAGTGVTNGQRFPEENDPGGGRPFLDWQVKTGSDQQ